MTNASVSSWVFVAVMLLGGVATGVSAPTSNRKDDATLSSDEMELIHQGNKAVFTGHVLLDRPPYQLKADKMTRSEGTGLIEVEGRILGTWHNAEGGKLDVLGEHGHYDPQTQIAELWTDTPKQVAVHWKDPHGSGDFLSDRAVMYVSTRTVQLVDHVTGHIMPAKP